MEKKVTVGGQAVIEGVMMKSKDVLATAVRKPDGEIIYRKKVLNNKFSFIKKIFFLRGVFMLLDSMFSGIKELVFSSNQAGEEEEELTNFQVFATMIVSISLGISIFMVLPSLIATLVGKFLTINGTVTNIVEGIIRVLLFITYIYGISFSKDIKRVFEYHGAEHKSIYTFENKEELNVDNAKKYTTLHPRCGTSFLFIVMIISIFVYSVADGFIPVPETHLLKVLHKVMLRVVFIPLIAGIAYEIQRLSSRFSDNKFFKLISYPGLKLQTITTKEPDEQELEVSLVALKAALGIEITNAKEIEEDKN